MDIKDTEIQKLGEEITVLEEADTNNKEEIEHLQLNVDLVVKQRNDLFYRKKVLDQKINDLNAEIARLKGTIGDLETENSIKDEKIANDEEKIDSMESEIEKLKNYTDDQVEELTEESSVSESSETAQSSSAISSSESIVVE